nr:EOG090X0APF [Leptodora kindtii]
MELPDLGQHCSNKACNVLDFLPMKCDACHLIYCKDHIRYELHSCQSSYKKNIQVPVCPLCNQPVPWKRGEAPDIAVGAHIDQDCQSDPAKSKRKVFGNRCSMKGCKQKEVVPVICDKCKLNHCLKHRHPCDHSCKGNNAADSSAGSYLARAREAALARSAAASTASSSKTRLPKSSGPAVGFSAMALQGNLSEDEALARALQASVEQEPSSVKQQEEADRLLALSLQQGEQVPPQQPTNSSVSSNCSLS